MENEDKKYFMEMLLALKVDDIKDAVKLNINPHSINDFLRDYEKRRKECQEIGIDTKEYDARVNNLTSKLNFSSVHF